mmetsp:Transcript_23545/g.41788  ORF Transcript_23545/g.41788 Transcript_23545/m.41788 type:complete len:89 (+) Transcript_23545:1245-1511(+)
MDGLICLRRSIDISSLEIEMKSSVAENCVESSPSTEHESEGVPKYPFDTLDIVSLRKRQRGYHCESKTNTRYGSLADLEYSVYNVRNI